MTRRLARAAALSLALLLGANAAASADPGTAQVLSSSIILPATGALHGPADPWAIAQAKPIGQQERPLREPGLPEGFSYTLDASFGYPLNSTGKDNVKFPGGIDAVAGYGFNRFFRLQAGFYQLPEYPVGFDQGTVPVYLQGVSSPIGSVDLHAAQQDVTIKNNIFVFNVQNLFTIAKKIPIVITPTYISRSGTVGGKADDTLIDVNGFPQSVKIRTFQEELIAVTLPFLSTPRMFGTYTIAPQWLVHTSGANVDNKAQLFQLLYIDYRVTDKATLFFQPSLLQNYTPTDIYSSHIPTLVFGANYKVTKQSFVQLLFSGGTPTNPLDGKIGVTSVTCQTVQGCATNQVVPRIGGLKAQQVQLQFGIGTPSVIPL
jgi:hypothetical protein